MITDRLTATHHFIEELAKQAGKSSFMPASEIGLALQYLEENGIPNNKSENYKYCNIETILRKEFKVLDGREHPEASETLRTKYAVKGAYNIFIENGKLVPSISDVPDKTVLLPIENASAAILSKHLAKYSKNKQDALVALNTAYADRGVFMEFNSSLKKPVVIHHINATQGKLFFNIRNLLILKENIQVSICEIQHKTTEIVFYNQVLEILLNDHASLNHCMLQQGGASGYSVKTTQAHQKKNSQYTNTCFTFSGNLVRNNLSTALDAEHAESNLFGLFVCSENQLVDNHTLVDHLKPNCQSNELYKGIIGGKATAVFNGQIFVERDAQKTNAYQSSKNILVSDDATINAKPELEIYANDVKCSHGTSTGKIDENALFYLKARGIGERLARKLLLQAFAYEVIDQIQDPISKEIVLSSFENTLSD